MRWARTEGVASDLATIGEDTIRPAIAGLVSRGRAETGVVTHSVRASLDRGQGKPGPFAEVGHIPSPGVSMVVRAGVPHGR